MKLHSIVCLSVAAYAEVATFRSMNSFTLNIILEKICVITSPNSQNIFFWPQSFSLDLRFLFEN